MNTLDKNKQNKKEKIAVVLLSGGLDSTTVATLAISRDYEVHALTIHYGQILSKEIQCAQDVAKNLKIRQKIVDISQYK